MLRPGVFLICCIVVPFQILWPQTNRQPRQREIHGGPSRPIYYEALNFPSEEPGQSRIDILFRIDLSLFVAVKNPDLLSTDAFIRRGEILVELIDSTGHSQARDIERIDAVSQSGDTGPGVREWHQGIMSFDVDPGRYTIAVDVEDEESDRHLLEKRMIVQAKDFSHGRPLINEPFLISGSSFPGGLSRILPQNYGAGTKLGEKGAFVVHLANFASQDPLRLEFSVTLIGQDQEKSTPAFADTLENVDLTRNIRPSPADTEAVPAYDLNPSTHPEAIAIIPFPAEKLPLESYTLTVRVSAADFDQTVSRVFETVWPEMPRSLQDPEHALEALRYIVTREFLDSLSRGNESESKKNVEAFWNSKDTTPETAYNEVMTEYYVRVDFASTTFATLRQPDGSRTDRGRIHILYGPPSATRRVLDPSGYIEEWSYGPLGRKFIFLDESRTGNYVLTSTQPL